MNRVFGSKKPDPTEQAKEWSRTMTREIRALERQIKTIEREESKVVQDIKKLSKDGARNESAIRILAKQVVLTRQTKTRIYEGKAQMHSVQMQLQQNVAIVKVAGCMKKSTEVMAVMAKLVSIPEIQSTMLQLAREMERAGLTEEIIGDALDDSFGTEDEVDDQVEKIIAEITATRLAGAIDAPTAVPETYQEQGNIEISADQEELARAEQDADLAQMKARLESL